MISRVADSCFWLTRYLERVDSLARLIGVHHSLHIDAGPQTQQRGRPLLEFVGRTGFYRSLPDHPSVDDADRVEHYLVWDGSHPASLHRGVQSVRENARTIREILSHEAWEAINDLWLWLRSNDARRAYDESRNDFYEHFTRTAVLFHGVSHASMLHDEAFTFMKLGRAVERTDLTARLLAIHHPRVHKTAEGESAALLAALRSTCAFEPFFRAGRPLNLTEVTRFLVFDPSLPRSVVYNLDEARFLLRGLRREDPLALPRRSRQSLERFRGELIQMDIGDIERRGIPATLDWVVRSTAHLCRAIHDDYLNPPMAWLRHCVRVLETVSPDEGATRAA